MPQIIPIRDLKNTSEISAMCHQTDEPIFVTKNGYGDMVIMSMKVFESGQYLHSVEKKLAEAEQAIEQGDTTDAASSLSALREAYGV